MQLSHESLTDEKYYHLLDQMHSLMFVQSVAGEITFFNKSWQEYIGKLENKSKKPNLINAIFPEDRNFLQNTNIDSSNSHANYYEFRLKDASGQYRWIGSYRIPIFDAKHKIQGYLYHCHDINKQKLQTDFIAESEERFNFAINATGVGVWDLVFEDTNSLHPENFLNANCKLFWNKNMFRIFNVNPEDFNNKYSDFEKCIHKDDRQHVKNQIITAIKNQKIFKAKFRLISHPDAIRFISFQAKASLDKSGNFIRLTGINQDITDLEVEKHKIQELNQELSEKEMKYRTLFESSADAIVLIADGKFIECNAAAICMFECAKKEALLGKSFIDFSPKNQADNKASAELAKQHIQQALKNGKASFNWIHKRMDGDEFHAEVLLAPVPIKAQHTIIQATIRDTTHLVKLQERLTYLSVHDQLTGLYNRNGFNTTLKNYLRHTKDSGESLAILMLDIDNFKDINDTYGHKAGDDVLGSLASIIKDNSRNNDIAIRFGGDEFIILLPGTNKTNAKKLANRIIHKVDSTKLKLANQQTFTYTISIGAATFPEDGKDKASILAVVDEALYFAKNSGKDRVHVVE